MRLVEDAPAKINLALHVRRRRADGYHDIESLFAFCRHGDVLSAEPADTLALEVTGAFADAIPTDDDNLVLRAARMLHPGKGARLRLEKNLPVAAGLGGGSADAAAALRLLPRLWGGGGDVMAVARALGADVPGCIASETVRGEGRGDDLTPVAHGLAGMPVLLVNPGVALTTPPVFAGWDGVDRGPLDTGEPLAAALAGRNDLEPPAQALAPVIGEVLAMLAALDGVVLARMSGSGATCFALFDADDAASAAAAVVRRVRPDWWVMATELR